MILSPINTMKPPYQITSKILELIASVSEKIGEVNAAYLYKPPAELRKKNRIKTIQSSLEIEITGLRNSDGLIMLQLLDENEKTVIQAKGVISVNKSVIVIKDLKPGRYAFRFFHDENLSGKMETGPLGIPKEGYGFFK